MTPLCVNCDRRPVGRAYGRYPVSKEFGARIVDGKKWKWFCGHACQGAYRGIAARESGQACEASRVRAVRRDRVLLSRLVAACQGQIDAEGRVQPQALVKALYREIKRERNLLACASYRNRLVEEVLVSRG